MDVKDRYRGAMLGLAAGDALGTTLEFCDGSHEPLTTIVGGGPYELKAGEWTDDTSMALCLAESLVTCRGFDASDQMERYQRWRWDGYMSSTGKCFDIGITVNRALVSFEMDGDPFAGRNPEDAGNGSLMRLAPVPLFFNGDPHAALKYADLSSLTTHGSREAADACRFYAMLILGALGGASKSELLAPGFSLIPGYWSAEPLSPKIAAIADGSFLREDAWADDDPNGYVVPSLRIALWAFAHTDNFRDGALAAVNLGRDADTYGAIYGQLAGAFYGETGIPDEWVEILAKRDLITSLAERLLKGE